jgi:hypothetical protein
MCGHPLQECSDPATTWYPQRHVDYAAMEQAAALWRYQALHEDAPYHDGSWRAWSKERTAATPYHFLDGVSVYVSTVDDNPADDFLTDENAAPWKPESRVDDVAQDVEQRDGNQHA